MDNNNLAGVIIMAICCFACAMLFFGIGRWAEQSKKPVHFWAGTKIDPEKVVDIPAYNHACARMWKVYSIPYWCCGMLSCLDSIDRRFSILSVALLFAACVPGILLLAWKYTQIEKQYINR